MLTHWSTALGFGLWALEVQIKMLLRATSLHVAVYSHFLWNDSACSAPGRGPLVPMTWLRNEPSLAKPHQRRESAEQAAECVHDKFTWRRRLGGGNDNLQISNAASQVEKIGKKSNFPRLEMLISQLFPPFYIQIAAFCADLWDHYISPTAWKPAGLNTNCLNQKSRRLRQMRRCSLMQRCWTVSLKWREMTVRASEREPKQPIAAALTRSSSPVCALWSDFHGSHESGLRDTGNSEFKVSCITKRNHTVAEPLISLCFFLNSVPVPWRVILIQRAEHC